MRKAVVVALFVVSSLACATAGQGGSPSAGGESPGEHLYRSHCGACHRLRDPSKRTREEWAAALERFGPRAHLSRHDRQLVLEYLQAHAKDAVSSGTGGGAR